MKIISAFLTFIALTAVALGQNEQAPIIEREFAFKDWTYKSVSGDTKVNLRDYSRGKKLVMVVYWAPWCPNWMHDLAFVQSLHEKYKDMGFAVVGVGEYDSTSKMRDHIEKNRLTFPMVYESEKLADRLTTVHYAQRTEAGDRRKWGSPWYVFLDPASLEQGGEFLTKKTTVVNGELVKQDAERFVQQKLGVAAAVSKIEECNPENKSLALAKP